MKISFSVGPTVRIAVVHRFAAFLLPAGPATPKDFSLLTVQLSFLILPVWIPLTLRGVVALLVTDLQLIRLPVVVHVEIGNFDAYFVKLSVGLAHFRNEA